MAITQADLLTSVLNLCGNHKNLLSSVVAEFIKTENKEIIENWNWSKRRTTVMVNTVAPITGGTISITQNTKIVTGVLTVFSASNVGQYLRIGDDSYFKIASFQNPLQITLESNYPYPNVVGSGYSIFQFVYSLPSTIEKIIAIKSRSVSLVERSKILIDMVDAAKTSTDSDPECWSYGDRDSSGNVTFEIWPPSSDAHPLIIQCLLTGDVVAPTDSPLYRADVLKWKAASDAAEYLDAIVENPNWAAKGKRYYENYEKSLQQAILDDSEKVSTPNTILPPERSIGMGDDFQLSRDTENIY